MEAAGHRDSGRGRRPWLIGFVLLFLAGCASSEGGAVPGRDGAGTSLRVMTYNVLFDFPNPDYDDWAVRKEHVAEIIRRQDPDLVGLQEPFLGQVEDLAALCPGYTAIHVDDLATDASLLVRTDRFELLDMGSYWLSPTPDVPWSGGLGTGFGNFLPRMVIWTRLEDLEAGGTFFFVNTHFDNTAPSQELSAPLFLERTEPLAAERPVIVTGDFNSKPSSEAYGILTTGEGGAQGGAPFRLRDSYFLATSRRVDAREGDPADHDPASRIDHIFVAGGDFACTRWIVDMTTYGEARSYPSDHFAVVAHLLLAGR